MRDDGGAQALAEQMSRAWDMLDEAVQAIPDEEWRTASDPRMQPARLVYHLLMAAERYNWMGAADDFAASRRFNPDWVNLPVDDFPGRESALAQVREAKADTLAWIEHFGADGLVTAEAMWPWTGESALAQGIYHLRHLQHHLAEMNVELRRRGLRPAAWK